MPRRKKTEPLFPRPAVTHRLQFLVILLAVPLEEPGQVEDRLVQHLSFAEQESDEQSSDAAIAVQKRVYRLELGVNQPDFDQQWQFRVGVEKVFQFGQLLWNFMMWWRNEGRLVQCAAGRADPVLAGSQLARCKTRTAYALQEFRVNFPDQPGRNRKFLEA